MYNIRYIYQNKVFLQLLSLSVCLISLSRDRSALFLAQYRTVPWDRFASVQIGRFVLHKSGKLGVEEILTQFHNIQAPVYLYSSTVQANLTVPICKLFVACHQ